MAGSIGRQGGPAADFNGRKFMRKFLSSAAIAVVMMAGLGGAQAADVKEVQ
ncbi:sugar ABC transporter substrate-binding protein, partial [Rhizobium pisi]